MQSDQAPGLLKAVQSETDHARLVANHDFKEAFLPAECSEDFSYKRRKLQTFTQRYPSKVSGIHGLEWITKILFLGTSIQRRPREHPASALWTLLEKDGVGADDLEGG